MHKRYFLVFLIVTIVLSASLYSFGAILKTTVSERSLYLNNVAVKGEFKFEYSINESRKTSACDFSSGPMLSYTTTAISGAISVPAPNRFLDSSFKKNSKFQVEYQNPIKGGNVEEVLFDGCQVTSSCKKKDTASGRDCYCYTFRAESALKKK